MNADAAAAAAAADLYLGAKKKYVERLNTVIQSNPTLWRDMIENNFDQADIHIHDHFKTKLSESSKSLEQLFFSSHIDDDERIRIAELILSPSDRNAYTVKPPPETIGNFEFLLIRKYDLPFIREFLRLTLIITGHLNRPGFDGLKNRDLFDKILTIGDKPLIGGIKDKDKFVLHSGVSFGKGRRDQHCPLIISLEKLMIEYNIPFDSRRPVVQHCLHQQETATEVDFETDPDDNGYANVVPMRSTRHNPPPIVVNVENDVENDVEEYDESRRQPNDAHFASGIPLRASAALSAPSVASSPQDQSFIAAQAAHPNLSALNVIGGPPTSIIQDPLGFGGRRTKKRKLSKRMKKRVTRNRKQKKTRKSLRNHKH